MRVAKGAGIDLDKAKALPPLEGKPAPGKNRQGPTYSDGSPEDDTPEANVAARPRKGSAGRDMLHR